MIYRTPAEGGAVDDVKAKKREKKVKEMKEEGAQEDDEEGWKTVQRRGTGVVCHVINNV